MPRHELVVVEIVIAILIAIAVTISILALAALVQPIQLPPGGSE
jgi:hypothetical protein